LKDLAVQERNFWGFLFCFWKTCLCCCSCICLECPFSAPLCPIHASGLSSNALSSTKTSLAQKLAFPFVTMREIMEWIQTPSSPGFCRWHDLGSRFPLTVSSSENTDTTTCLIGPFWRINEVMFSGQFRISHSGWRTHLTCFSSS
jgi:hypothetical protein